MVMVKLLLFQTNIASSFDSLQMSLLDISSSVMEEIKEYLQKEYQLNNVNLGKLLVNSFIIDFVDDEQKSYFGMNEYLKLNPTFASEIPLTFKINKDRSDELLNFIKRGEITFEYTFTYNGVYIDKHVENLSIETIRESKFFQDMQQEGSYLITATQKGDAINRLITEIKYEIIQYYTFNLMLRLNMNLFQLKDCLMNLKLKTIG